MRNTGCKLSFDSFEVCHVSGETETREVRAWVFNNAERRACLGIPIPVRWGFLGELAQKLAFARYCCHFRPTLDRITVTVRKCAQS